MVLINEWLPNPIGKDSEGEWVEVFNSGSEAVDLSGWYLKTKSKTKFLLSGEITSDRFVVFKKPDLKLSLNNVDGELFLYDTGGTLVDHQSFLGSAPEGKSLARLSFSEKNFGGFLFTEPTPGAENKFLEQRALINNSYSYGVPLNKPLGTFDFVWLALGVAVVLTGLIMFVIKSNENLSKLFFRRDEDAWQ